MKKFSATALIVGLIVLGGVSAWAYGPCSFDNWNSSLSQEQKAELQKVWSEFMTQTQESRAKIAANMEQLRTLYAQPNPDKRKIEALQYEIIDLRASLSKQAVAVQASLTDEFFTPFGHMCMGMINDHPGGWHRGDFDRSMRDRGFDSGRHRGPGHRGYPHN